MAFRLTILGCGSAVPSIDENTTAQLLNVNERFFLIDCGEGTQIQLRKNRLSFQRIGHIFISHLHGDHYFGLIGLINSMHLLGRKKDLHIYAHHELKEIIKLQMAASKTELRFPLFFHSLSDEDQILFEDEDIQIKSILLKHSIKCSGFIFKEKKHKRKIIRERLEEYNIPFDFIKSLKSGKDYINSEGKTIKNKILTKLNSPPYSYAFCSDTSFYPKIVRKIKGVDLLYHETTFKEDLKERAKLTGHSTCIEAAEIAKRAGVKNLMIGHYSQRYKNLNELQQEAQTIFQKTILAKSGLTIDFKAL